MKNISIIKIVILVHLQIFSYSQKNAFDYSTEYQSNYQKGEYEKSIEILNEAILKFPNNRMFYVDRGLAKSQLKLYVESIIDYSEAIRLDSTTGVAFFYRSQAKVNLKDLRGAISDLDIYIRNLNKLGLTFDLGQAYYNRGMLHLQIDKNENGCLDLSKAGELGVSRAYEMIQKYCQ